MEVTTILNGGRKKDKPGSLQSNLRCPSSGRSREAATDSGLSSRRSICLGTGQYKSIILRPEPSVSGGQRRREIIHVFQLKLSITHCEASNLRIFMRQLISNLATSTCNSGCLQTQLTCSRLETSTTLSETSGNIQSPPFILSTNSRFIHLMKTTQHPLLTKGMI